jgi:hypothetical protein
MNKMDSAEFTEWLAYDKVEMPLPSRSDWNNAMIVKAIFDVNRGKGQNPINLDDCKLDFDTAPLDEKEQEDRVMQDLLKIFESNPAFKKVE